MTLEELAMASGVSIRALSDIERGHSRGPQARSVQALAKVLGLDDQDAELLLTAARTGRQRIVSADTKTEAEPTTGFCDLPFAVPDFAGREPETGWLGESSPERSLIARVAIVSGTAGVGKSTLVAHAAAQARADFPGGLFFVDLRGLDPEPVKPGFALQRLLRALGVPEGGVPATPAERRDRYRELIRDRRALIILDNAADEDQVRPLLPPPGPATVWITSRRALTGLDDSRRLALSPLDADAAARLFAAITGATDPEALPEIVRLCGNLPLALRIAGNRLLSRPSWTPRILADRLANEERRIDRLTAGDLHIRTAFTLSYDQLSPTAQQLFRRLSLVTTPDAGPALGAVLTRLPPHRVEQTMNELVELGLLTRTTADRCGFHDLIRLYASARLQENETDQDRTEALERLRGWLLRTATRAGQWFEPRPGHAGEPESADEEATLSKLVDLDSRAAAKHWLAEEADNWFEALRAAAEQGRHATVVNLAEAMHWYSDHTMYWGHWHDVFALSRAAAHALGDLRTEATHLNYLSWAYSLTLGRHADGAAAARAAAELARQSGDLAQEGWSWNYAGGAAFQLGDYEGAFHDAIAAVALMRTADEREGLPQTLNLAGCALRELGRTEEALLRFREVVALVTDPVTAPTAHIAEATAMITHRYIGITHARQEDWPAAEAAYRAALKFAPKVENANLTAHCLVGLATALRSQDKQAEVIRLLREALEIFRKAKNEAGVTQTLGELCEETAEIFGPGAKAPDQQG
jgi:tetratricopeptide (TPR) repeat protein/transcriptional regulator with XRE-family HTH domain